MRRTTLYSLSRSRAWYRIHHIMLKYTPRMLSLIVVSVLAYLPVLVLSIDPWMLPHRSQVVLSLAESHQADNEHDPAGQPNLATRIEVTSQSNASLFCAKPDKDDAFESGYAHFTNPAGVEDKHMFWWYVPAFLPPANVQTRAFEFVATLPGSSEPVKIPQTRRSSSYSAAAQVAQACSCLSTAQGTFVK